MVPGLLSPTLLLPLLPLTLSDHGQEHPWQHNPYAQTNLYDYPDQLQSEEFYYNYFPNHTYVNTIANTGSYLPVRRTIGSLVEDIDISVSLGKLAQRYCVLKNIYVTRRSVSLPEHTLPGLPWLFPLHLFSLLLVPPLHHCSPSPGSLPPGPGSRPSAAEEERLLCSRKVPEEVHRIGGQSLSSSRHV